jgi:lipopolysaccharide/colanic/teichoic acid biosynthesis glycosyltransferase
VIRSLGVSLIIAALDNADSMPRLYPHLKRLRFDGVEVLTPLGVAEIYRGITPLSMVDEEIIMEASMQSGLPMIWRMKRLYDIVIALAACLMLLPVALLIVLALKATAPFSPVFYTQMRVGQFGKTFRIYKFRTMRRDAEKSTGPVWAARDDLRVTLLGRFLRRFRLDEIPQFINILSGDMSLVGPRPERPEIVERLEREIPFYRERENITPGLTGWAQVRYPYGESVEDAARKLEYDLYYMKHLSISLDLQIILSTLRIVLLGKERVI